MNLAARPRRPDPACPCDRAPRPFGLTDRELAVLRPIAEGETNWEIGAALFTRKTGIVHVTNILRKLGVGTKVQAAAVAERAGLLPAD